MKKMNEVVNGLKNDTNENVVLGPINNRVRLELVEEISGYDGGSLFNVSYTCSISDGYQVFINLHADNKDDWETTLKHHGHSEFVKMVNLAVLCGIHVDIIILTDDTGVIGTYINSGDVGSIIDSAMYNFNLNSLISDPSKLSSYYKLCDTTKVIIKTLNNDPRVKDILEYEFQSGEVKWVLERFKTTYDYVNYGEQNNVTEEDILNTLEFLGGFTSNVDYVYKLAVMFDDEDDREAIIEMDNN